MRFDTIQDMEEYVYGQENLIVKVDAPLLSSTSGVFNAVFGAKVWSQLNQTANTWGMLPKYPWPRSGFRVLSARAAASGGGLAESAAVPDTIKPTFVEVTVTGKQVGHTFEISFLHEALAGTEDDAIAFDELRSQMATHHAEMLNIMLWTDVDTLASNNFESIDRIVSSNAELTNLSLDANDSDIYGIDRDAGASWADAYVDDNSGTDRNLTDAMIRDLIRNTENNGANPQGQLFVTGYDTYADILGLYQSQVRYSPLESATVQPSVNGIQTDQGSGAGMRIATLYGRPLIRDKNVPADTKSRVFLLDVSDPQGLGRPRLGVAILQPTLYFETRSPFENDKLSREGMFLTMGEVVCTFFAAQGKIRDLL